MSATTEVKITERGERLPNGAVLIDKRIRKIDVWADGTEIPIGYCLAVRPGSDYEYVTWQYVIRPDAEITASGRYFADFYSAVRDYEERCGA